MALIGKIRSNSWLLIVMIGLGLGGFIFMDMFSGNKSVFGSSQFTVGDINGQKLDWNQFNRTEQLLYGNSGGDVYNRREVLWNSMVEQVLVKEEAEDLGLGVSREELLDLQFGDNTKLSPIIVQRFQDPATRQVNRQRLNELKTSIETGTMTDPNIRSYWAYQEKEIINERLKSKINNMVSKALYTPTFMVEMAHDDQNAKRDIAYVRIPFDEVENDEVALTDADYQNYLNENAALYETTEPTRQVEYAVFDVKPTEQDLATLKEDVAKLLPDFRTTTEDDITAFVDRNFGSADAAYVKKTALSPAIADTVASMQVGAVYGPYEEGNAFKAVKLVAKKTLPDSVRARHILLRASNPVELQQAQKTADSLLTVLESNQETFDSLASKFGTDGTASKGGDLDFAAPGQMVKPFNDLIFFQAEPGEVNTVTTQFGVHVVEVTDRKYENNDTGYRVAYLSQNIVPSEETQNNLYDEILEFVSANRSLDAIRTAISSREDVEMVVAPAFKKNDYVVGSLGSNQSSRDIVRWAFDSSNSIGDVSTDIYAYQDPVQYYNNKYVVVGLKNTQEGGQPSVAMMRDQIEQQVINRKKAALITEKISDKDLAAVATMYDTKVDTASNVTFDARQITGIGNEPKVIAQAFNTEANQMSAPVTGNNGVYVIKPTRTAGATTSPNVAQLRKTTGATTRSQISGALFQNLKKNADIEDNRAKFY